MLCIVLLVYNHNCRSLVFLPFLTQLSAPGSVDAHPSHPTLTLRQNCRSSRGFVVTAASSFVYHSCHDDIPAIETRCVPITQTSPCTPAPSSCHAYFKRRCFCREQARAVAFRKNRKPPRWTSEIARGVIVTQGARKCPCSKVGGQLRYGTGVPRKTSACRTILDVHICRGCSEDARVRSHARVVHVEEWARSTREVEAPPHLSYTRSAYYSENERFRTLFTTFRKEHVRVTSARSCVHHA